MNLRRASGIAFGLMLLAVLGVPGQPGGEKGKDGKKGPPPFELGRVLPPFVRNDLELTEDQRKQIADLEKEVLTKLQTILTKDQLKRIQDMGAKGGKGPPDGKGKDKGPPDGKGKEKGPKGGDAKDSNKLPVRPPLEAPEATGSRKPNVIIIYIDDLAYADIGPFGSKKNRTPNLDRMAKEGMKLTSFYAAPVCTASRTTLMTGCYAKRVGMPGVLFPVSPVGLHPSEKTIAEYLKHLGYLTFIIGKWHLGDQLAFLPTRRGFDHFFGLPYSNDMAPNPKKADKKKANMPPLPLLRDERVIEAPVDQSTLTERYTDEAVKFIHASKDKPFFLYLPHTAVHNPFYPGKAFLGKSKNGVYGDWVEEMDWSVGKVMDTVRELKLEKDTLVIFSSDNGGTPQGDNGPLRGNKASTWEGGVRVCAMAWWPGKIAPGSTCNEMAATFDVLPTVVPLAGGNVDGDRVIDGKDIRPLLFGAPGAKTPHEALYFFKQGAGDLDSVRSGPWKYRLNEKSLYNLDKDLGEKTDVAGANPEVIQRILPLVQKMDADLGVNKAGPGCRPAARVESPRPLLKPAKD